MTKFRSLALSLILTGASAFSLSKLGENRNAVELSAFRNRRDVIFTAASAAVGAGVLLNPTPANARLEAVNRPDLLPTEAGKNIIQVEKFLTKGQEKRLDDKLAKLEAATGFRVRVLCQAYPQTPGLAIRDYWDLGKDGQKDDKYIVLVVDQFGGKGNVLNFNVGDGVKFALPNVFWTRLQAKFGTVFFVKENGIDSSIENAIDSVYTCLMSEDQFCVNVPDAAVDLQTLR
mmetsp:Transcript_15625/g.24298  ORF Transcript_15625/g.24298 Transcript_15625/m.24298 type:complete len:231 (+) Transcript_15625:98-790(+)|eukprot:CAMPEP_0196811818 /NCGR_PEP_ID=MMETSP1362-20130617/20073_1 /TAXON_ID=163516 /ORGANISM="Leptocylindrus danicus, Strain CCMP1856" /LENGTH=230 /DNA_ID=CAMNT_0042187201 /DNA_START=72 /DNA_END=764 /DNA_ORIENTATION=-